MKDFARLTLDFLLDRSPQEAVATVLLAMALAGVLTGFFALIRRKVSDPLVVMVGLVLVANLVSMVTAAGYVVYVRRTSDRPRDLPSTAATGWPPPDGPRPRRGPYGPPPPGRTFAGTHRTSAAGRFSAPVFVAKADDDKDGRLSPEEAARFLREADKSGRGSVDARDIENALRGRAARPPHGGPGPDLDTRQAKLQADDEG